MALRYTLAAVERDEAYVEVATPDGPEHRLVGRTRFLLEPDCGHDPERDLTLVVRLPRGVAAPEKGEYRLALVLVRKES